MKKVKPSARANEGIEPCDLEFHDVIRNENYCILTSRPCPYKAQRRSQSECFAYEVYQGIRK